MLRLFFTWLLGRRPLRHEEITARYKAMRGKTVAEFEQEILERLYQESAE